MIRKAIPQFVLLFTLIALAGFSQAQTRRTVTLEASVPFEFVVGNRAFPAGTYVFELATGSPQLSDQAGVLIVRNHERKLFAAVATDVAADAAPHASPKLVFQRAGDRVYLSKVWKHGNAAGLSVHLVPAIAEPEDWEATEMLTLDALPVAGGI